MSERKFAKGDGTTTVVRDGRIVTNLPADKSLNPTSGEDLGTELTDASSQTPPVPEVGDVHELYEQKKRETPIWVQNRRDFDAWVGYAAFAAEEDSTRGAYWDGAVRYAVTEEGRERLQQILDNPEATTKLRLAVDAMVLEVELYADSIEADSAILAGKEDQETQKRKEPYRDRHGRPLQFLSEETYVTGDCDINIDVRSEGTVHIRGSVLTAVRAKDSVIESSTVKDARIDGSNISSATVQDTRSLEEKTRMPTRITKSAMEPGAVVSGAEVNDSTIRGTVQGTGTKTAGLKGSTEITSYHIKIRDRWDERTEQAPVEIGVRAEDATYSHVDHSIIGVGSHVRNSTIRNSTLSDGVDTVHAVVENCTLEGTAHVEGNYRHVIREAGSASGWRIRTIAVGNGEARVANVHLTHEYVGVDADVAKQEHVESINLGNRVVTRYRTRWRGEKVRILSRVWGYTETTVDPKTGSLKRRFIGFGDDKQEPEIPELKKLF